MVNVRSRFGGDDDDDDDRTLREKIDALGGHIESLTRDPEPASEPEDRSLGEKIEALGRSIDKLAVGLRETRDDAADVAKSIRKPFIRASRVAWSVVTLALTASAWTGGRWLEQREGQEVAAADQEATRGEPTSMAPGAELPTCPSVVNNNNLIVPPSGAPAVPLTVPTATSTTV